MNFYDGPGEAAHKTFVKSAGQKTQRKVGKLAQQTAHHITNPRMDWVKLKKATF
jgi:hypothetical protein